MGRGCATTNTAGVQGGRNVSGVAFAESKGNGGKGLRREGDGRKREGEQRGGVRGETVKVRVKRKESEERGGARRDDSRYK